MTEAEWRTSEHLFGLLDFARDRVEGWRLEAYALFWVARVRHLLDEYLRGRVSAYERAVGRAPPAPHAPYTWGGAALTLGCDARDCSRGAAERLLERDWVSAALGAGRGYALDAVYGPSTRPASVRFPEAYDLRERFSAVAAEVVRGQLFSLRCVAGNPFREVPGRPEWHTSTAVALARHVRESRDFAALPILADALQDAGCDNDDILGHCRGPGPHVRGCSVIDLVLGKS
jgi:hypothetical protein